MSFSESWNYQTRQSGLCKLIPNWTQNHMITYTNNTCTVSVDLLYFHWIMHSLGFTVRKQYVFSGAQNGICVLHEDILHASKLRFCFVVPLLSLTFVTINYFIFNSQPIRSVRFIRFAGSLRITEFLCRTLLTKGIAASEPKNVSIFFFFILEEGIKNIQFSSWKVICKLHCLLRWQLTYTCAINTTEESKLDTWKILYEVKI